MNEYHRLFLETWDDFLKDANANTGRKFIPARHLIKCRICALEAPAASPNAIICEMCFDTELELRSLIAQEEREKEDE